MAAARIGLMIIEGVTLAEITAMSERLEARGAQVIVVVPTGGAILPISGRYYPAAGGHGTRRPLSQCTAADLDLIVLPDGITGERLIPYPKLLRLIRGRSADGDELPMPVFTYKFLLTLLDRGGQLDALARDREAALSGGPPRR